MVALHIPMLQPLAEVMARTQRCEREATNWEALRGEWDSHFAAFDVKLDLLDEAISNLMRFQAARDPVAEQGSTVMWSGLWEALLQWGILRESVKALAQAPIGAWLRWAIDSRYDRTIRQTRTLLTAFPDLVAPAIHEVVTSVSEGRPESAQEDLAIPEMSMLVERARAAVYTIRISPLAHLRAMWNLWWSAVRHPFSETTIDLSTGRVLSRA